MKNKKILAILTISAIVSAAATGCSFGGDEPEEQVVVTETPAPEATATPTPEPTIAPDVQDSTYTSSNGDVSIKLPDATWSNKADEADMLSFESPEQGKILILHGQGEEDMSSAMLPDTQDLAVALEQASDLAEGTDFEIQDYTASDVEGVGVYSYTVKYTDASKSGGYVYAIHKIYKSSDEYYNICGSVVDEASYAGVKAAVDSFGIAGESSLKAAAPVQSSDSADGSTEGSTDGSTDGTQSAGTDSASSGDGSSDGKMCIRDSNGTMQVGNMMAFIQYAMQIIMSFLMITAISIMLPRANVAAGRICEVLEMEPSVNDPEEPVMPDKQEKGTVEFDHVSFAYPEAGENVINDITFKAEKGQTVAIIGSTGSGKSTLINLIPRFYDVTKGCVKVDGVDVRNMTQHELRDRLGYVPQKGVLFSGTIDSNIRYGKPDMPEEDVKLAAQIAQSDDFIEAKPEGYKAPISQGGNNVSGGQKQRLSIARAIAKKPEILIFDDSFSALDFKTDSKLRKALKEKTKDITTIIVAQRISTILNADQIIVLDDGNMAGIGTHKELMKNCEVYRQIAMSQLSEEELA